jgi:NAD(P)H dehydrogenase (quinone)
MCGTMVQAFEQRGDAVTLSDLYAMNFNPVLSGADFKERRDPNYLIYALEQRHALEQGALADDIAREVERVEAADLLAFSFPLFWFSPPAILKGWIERVFLSGLFYGGRRVYDRAGLVGKRAFTAFSLGGRPHMFGDEGIHGELETGMLKHFLQGTLGYVGLTVYEPFAAFHVPYISADERADLLTRLRLTIADLDQRPTMAFPSLEDFDLHFRPKPMEV